MAILVPYLQVLLTGVRERDEGQGLAEYGLILALVAAVAVAALTGLGGAIVNALGQVVNSF